MGGKGLVTRFRLHFSASSASRRIDVDEMDRADVVCDTPIRRRVFLLVWSTARFRVLKDAAAVDVILHRMYLLRCQASNEGLQVIMREKGF